MAGTASFRRLLLVALSLTVVLGVDGRRTGGKRWAVIVAGAKDYANYFSQADACHMYHVVRNGGIPAENIIQLNYDDIANAIDNPFKNNLVNAVNGSNVHEGCVIDYRGDDVTPEVFLNVMTGNKTGVEKLTGKPGKVLESGPDDDVFLYMADHGDSGMFFFPGFVPLKANQLNKAFKSMNQQNMYNQMVVIVESCYSGSMFEDILPNNMNIFAMTAANAHESAYMSCYDKVRGVFLSSVFSYSVAYNLDEEDRQEVTFGQLFKKAYKACVVNPDASHPKMYGDLTINAYPVVKFLGTAKAIHNGHSCPKLPNYLDDTVKALFDEFGYGLEQEFLTLEFLEHPPTDMVGIATLMRRLMSKTLTDFDIQALKKELHYSLRVKRFANDLTLAVMKEASGDDDNLLPNIDSHDNRDSVKHVDCYIEALSLIRSRCPVLDPQRFAFLVRNFKPLMSLCNQLEEEAVMNAITRITSSHRECNE